MSKKLVHVIFQGHSNEITLELLKTLIDSEVDIDFNAKDREGFTPLYSALESNNQEAARLLLEHGADPIYTIHKALFEEEFEIINRLLEDFDIPETPLLSREFETIAIFDRSDLIPDEIYELLLTYGIKKGFFTPNYALYVEAFYSNLSPGKHDIILKVGANVNYVMTIEDSKNKRSILMEACFRKNKDVVPWLIEKGADVNAIVNGRSALMCACFSGSMEIVDLLLGAGADPTFGKDGRSALMCAKKNGDPRLIEKIEWITNVTNLIHF